MPLVGHATVTDRDAILRGAAGRLKGVVEGAVRGPVSQAHALGEALADELLSRGAHEILRDFGRTELTPNS